MSALTPLGELLVRAGLISPQQLETVLRIQAQAQSQLTPDAVPPSGSRLGRVLVREGMITDAQLTQILSQQLSVPWVSLRFIDFTRPLLELVPSAIADRYRILPIHIRRLRGVGDVLYVATSDPLDEDALRAVADSCGLPVRPMIACQADIAEALFALYGVRGSLAPKASDEQAASLESIYPDSVAETPSRRTPPPLSRRAAARAASEATNESTVEAATAG